MAGIWGTNPAGGGYQGISPTYLLAHKNCNIAVGDAGIVSGMSPKGFFDEEGAEAIITAPKNFKDVAPGLLCKNGFCGRGDLFRSNAELYGSFRQLRLPEPEVYLSASSFDAPKNHSRIAVHKRFQPIKRVERIEQLERTCRP